jgi:hypothetical protein
MQPSKTTVSGSQPSFFLCVNSVISFRSEKEMIGVNAQRVVTMMADKQSTRVFAMMQKIRNSMCSIHPLGYAKLHISSILAASYKAPAISVWAKAWSFINAGVKAVKFLLRKLGKCKMFDRHDLNVLSDFA